MRPWQQGDPVGMGLVYLPDKKTREAYGKACRDAWIESAARHAIQLRTLQERRDFINSHRDSEALKVRVAELWEKRHEQN